MSKQQFTTPKGIFNWATINGNGKENLNGELQYTVDVSVPVEEAKDAIATLDALWDEHKPKSAKKAKSMGYKFSKDDDQTVIFTMKTKTTFPSGDKKTISVFNAQAQKIAFPDDKKIGNGTIGRAAGVAAIYDAGKLGAGVTLYLDSVQIIKLIEYVGGNSSFDAEEGGFDGFSDLPFNPADLDD